MELEGRIYQNHDLMQSLEIDGCCELIIAIAKSSKSRRRFTQFYFDDFYSSITLFGQSAQQGIRALGTIRKDRVNSITFETTLTEDTVMIEENNLWDGKTPEW